MTSNISVGDVIAKVADLYRRYAGVLLPVAAIVFLIEGVLQWIADDSLLLSFVFGIVGIVLTYLYTGMVVHLVDDVRDGRLDQSVGELFSRVTPVLATLIVASILAGIGIVIGLILFIIPGLVLLTLWAVVAPVILLERAGVIDAFKRSMALVRPSMFQVFAVIVLFFLISFAVSIILGAIGLAGGEGLQAALAWLGRVLTAPLTALGAAVLYFELRGARGESTTAPPAGDAADAGLGGTA